MAKKLTRVQEALLEKLRNGWEAGTSNDARGRSWIQYKGIGRGGQAETVNGSTLHALAKAGHIKMVYGFPTKRWVLLDPA